MHSYSVWWKKQNVRTPLQVQEEGKAVSKEIQKEKKKKKETTGYITKIQDNFTIVTITSLRFALEYASRQAESCFSNSRNTEELGRWKAPQQSVDSSQTNPSATGSDTLQDSWLDYADIQMCSSFCSVTHQSKEIPSYDFFFFLVKLHCRIQFRTTPKLEYFIFLNLWNL